MPDFAEPIRPPRLGRRTLMRGAGGAAFGVASIAALKLPLFSVSGARQDPTKCFAKDISATDKKLIVSNWPAYIDPRADGPTNTRDVFEKQTGITVKYTDDVNDNSEFFAKVRNQLGACATVKRDMFVLTDWMAARMIDLGWIQPLDASKVPNLHKNLIKPLQGKAWDPDLTYHAPWQSGLTGIAYNAGQGRRGRLVRGPADPRRPQGQDHPALGDARHDGLHAQARRTRTRASSPTTSGPTRSRSCAGTSRTARCAAFTGNEYIQDLTAGNILACEAWSGDVIQAQFDNPDIKFVTPEEGLSLWSDNMLIPNLAQHTENAEAWIDYYYDPEVAAKLAAWVNYICPVEGAKEEMEKIDPSLVDNQLIFPDEDTLSKTFDFMALSENQITQYEGDWSDVTGG